MSVKSSIGWCSTTCNPIRGLCQGNCRLPDGRAYCYYSGERGIAKRFKQDPILRLDLSVFNKLPKAPKKVFLCSTNDLFGNWIPDEWREAIRKKTQEYPQHTFQVLTKQPWNLAKGGLYPENWWVGVTATDTEMAWGAMEALWEADAKVKYISFEPLLNGINLEAPYDLRGIDWVIIGRLTGFGHKFDPKIEWVEEIVQAADKAGVKVFLKDNLKPLLKGVEYNIYSYSKWAGKQFAVASDLKTPLSLLRQEMPE